MTQERWSEIRQRIKDSFKITDAYTEELNPGTAETLEFETPQGLLQARFTRRPKIMEKKTIYSNRIGGDVKVNYTYSDEEVICQLSVYRWNTDREEWEDIEHGKLF